MGYRDSSAPKEEKVKFVLKDWHKGVIIGTGLILGFCSLVYGIVSEARSNTLHREHDLFVLRQEICAVANGWYVPGENYHGLIGCRSLSDHSQFYVVEDTGMSLVPVDR